MECAVVGIPDPVHGEIVTAVVIPKPGVSVTMDELITHCKERIAAFKVPVFVEVRGVERVGDEAYEGLPKNATGKVVKTVLRKEVEASWARWLAGKGSRV
jgi:acyl-CoA synthetase (AMP-forming)/AMP-acid ligase II